MKVSLHSPLVRFRRRMMTLFGCGVTAVVHVWAKLIVCYILTRQVSPRLMFMHSFVKHCAFLKAV